MNNDLISSVKAHWDEILKMVKEDLELPDVSFKMWLMPLKVSSIEGDTFIITPSDSDINCDYIRKKYGKNLQVAISTFFDHKYEVEFKREDEIISESAKNTSINRQTYSQGLIPNYTFDNFIEGPNSRMAYAAALQVAESPGENFNPLFIYGGSGLGKTHLMHAIGNYVTTYNPSKKVLYVTSEDFTNEIVKSILEGKSGKSTPEETRNKYRNLDVLLIDDIQFIISKESTQEEFFNTFNALYQAHKAIVITSDKPPKEFKTLEDRLRSRFDSGLVVDIQPPTYEIRLAILKQKLEAQGVDIKEDVLSYIAENVTSNIRELEGALTKIVALYKLQRLSKEEITLDLAKKSLESIISTANKKKIDIDYIAEVVADHYGISINDIYSPKRARNISYPRMIVMYLGRELTNQSLTEIGDTLGGRDHTTILHGVQTITNDKLNSKTIADTIDILIKKINPQ